ncbi:MAG: PQQ-binding-like beta-propeller repeat protein [Gemmataceae bacterium]
MVVCLDKATGKEVWKVDRASDGTDENEHSYASAVLWQNGKEAYLVCHGNDYTTAHSLQDGKEIWRLMGLNPRAGRYHRTLRFVASPACSPGLIVVPTAKREKLVAVRPDATGEVQPGGKAEAWRIPKDLTPDVPSPLIHDGLVYVHGQDNGGGLLACLDAATGAVVYRGAIAKGRHRASAVLADNKIYLVARDGTTTVVQPGKGVQEAGDEQAAGRDRRVAGGVRGRIYLRGFKYLWAVEERK